ncbi:MAG: hypothetical protein C0417_05390 [Chlorobiaceae bacterium]|nr:hypothetical protein [Chlorobiaceae bacterium]
MTAQMADRFLCNNDQYSLIGIKGGGLCTPKSFGMESEMMSTACYRGFHALYELTEKELILREFTLNEPNNNYVPIGDVKPIITEYYGTYEKLNVIVDFTGKIRLAKDFLREFYIHMGYQKASAYETIYDITIEHGRVLVINNRSEEMKQKRGQFMEQFESGNLKQSIDNAFSLDMDLI